MSDGGYLPGCCYYMLAKPAPACYNLQKSKAEMIEMSSKHAYLIIAHNDFAILEKLIHLLDDPRNDIYLHVDKKVSNFDADHFKNLVTRSSLFVVERIDVRWGDFSMVECEYILLKAAAKGTYSYYHLLSGVDLPLQSNDNIHRFFEANQGKEFIHFATREEAKSVEDRVLHYHFMRLPRNLPRYVNFACRLLHKATQYTRKWDQEVSICYGAQWFSITHALAEYVISKERWVRTYFKHSSCSDELFLQTIVYNSDFFKNLYHRKMDNDFQACMRCIDWNRGHPYVFRKEDYNFLMNSNMLFARKFSTSVDSEIICKIYSKLTTSGQER